MRAKAFTSGCIITYFSLSERISIAIFRCTLNRECLTALRNAGSLSLYTRMAGLWEWVIFSGRGCLQTFRLQWWHL
jgi:hypothetical protein